MKINHKFYTNLIVTLYLIILINEMFKSEAPSLGGLTYLQCLNETIQLNPFKFKQTFAMSMMACLKFIPLCFYLDKTTKHKYWIIYLIIFIEFMQGITLRGYCDIYDIIFGSVCCMIFIEIKNFVQDKIDRYILNK